MRKPLSVLPAVLLLVSLTACNSGTEPSTSLEALSTVEPETSMELLKTDTPSAEAEASPEAIQTPDGQSSILVAYFTWADNTVVENPDAVDIDATTSASVLAPGNTAQLAEWIQAEVGGDLFPIKVTEPYSSDYDECLDRAADEKADNVRPALLERVENMDDYDVIFLGYPNW